MTEERDPSDRDPRPGVRIVGLTDDLLWSDETVEEWWEGQLMGFRLINLMFRGDCD